MTFSKNIAQDRYLSQYSIGIIGCGHLGQTIGQTLLEHNFPRDNLRVSYGGRPETLANIKKAGLAGNVTSNAEICRYSNVIFISLKPQEFIELRGMVFSKQAMVVSCMAGIAAVTLRNLLGLEVFRIMPSSPGTICQSKGIVALYPDHDILKNILAEMGLSVYEISNEEMLHIFTAGVCLPAAILAARKFSLPSKEAVKTIGEEYPGFENIYEWAVQAVPVFGSEARQREYIGRMLTPGGVTEAIVNSLYAGDGFLAALRKGIARSRSLTEKANQLIQQLL
jgi:Pyrroline-5-carboxylate reductase